MQKQLFGINFTKRKIGLIIFVVVFVFVVFIIGNLFFLESYPPECNSRDCFESEVVDCNGHHYRFDDVGGDIFYRLAYKKVDEFYYYKYSGTFDKCMDNPNKQQLLDDWCHPIENDKYSNYSQCFYYFALAFREPETCEQIEETDVSEMDPKFAGWNYQFFCYFTYAGQIGDLSACDKAKAKFEILKENAGEQGLDKNATLFETSEELFTECKYFAYLARYARTGLKPSTEECQIFEEKAMKETCNNVEKYVSLQNMYD